MANSLLKELLQPSMEQYEEATTGYGIDTIEYASLEMMEAAAEVDRHEQAAAELQEISAGLESISESMTASLEQGGMDPVAAQFAHHAVGAYTERLGIEAADQLPALESFGGDTGRQSSTEVSLESIGETMCKVFEASRRAIEAVIKSVADFFSKLFSNAEKLQKAVGVTLKKVKDAKGSPSGKTRVPNGDTLAYQGKLDMGSVTTGLDKTRSVYNVMSTEYLAAVTKGKKEAAQVLGNLAPADTTDEFKKAFEVLLNYDKELKTASMKAQGEISGGRTISIEEKGEGDDAYTETVFTKADKEKKPSSYEIDTPNRADLIKMLEVAQKIAGDLKDSKKNIDNAVGVYREVHKVTDKLNKDAKGGKLGKAWADAKARRAVNRASRNVVRPVQQLSHHCWSVTRSAVSMAEASLKNYKSE